MNCFQLINSLLLAAKNIAHNNTAAANATTYDADTDTGGKDSDTESEFFDDEAAVEDSGGGDTFEFVADPNRSVGNEGSDAVCCRPQ